MKDTTKKEVELSRYEFEESDYFHDLLESLGVPKDEIDNVSYVKLKIDSFKGGTYTEKSIIKPKTMNVKKEINLIKEIDKLRKIDMEMEEIKGMNIVHFKKLEEDIETNKLKLLDKIDDLIYINKS